jgi:hypothetical protein
MWPQHKVDVYEQMVAALRHTLEEQSENIPAEVLERLNGIIRSAVHSIDTSPEIVAVGLPDIEPEVLEPVVAEAKSVDSAAAAASTAVDPFRHGAHAEANRMLKARQLARWLWDRDIGGDQMAQQDRQGRWRQSTLHLGNLDGCRGPDGAHATAGRFGDPTRGQRTPASG